ncbi:DEAD/DEAH box helicase [Guptibacillus hwajinpoensis]|uniref:DEAD/DEAH box helicase domain-containing protein n=1 Tax=Guptibacillus hwajinpoensis TaxID=208199 RepID=A0ABU0K1U2_9BACL|nr:DEAD/DEAH box helicase [Alkalihalobacillus hemicentroti]MDQ0483320.1 DEAD/DEAH box helicase domain-containing protein [Alkalihalobacillus hemicentroti]
MERKRKLPQLLDMFQQEEKYRSNIVTWKTIEPKDAKTAPFPEDVSPVLREALFNRGINELYTHQASAYKEATDGHSFVAVTPTASGKTLCYNLPVLDTILKDPSSRALYLFPTKALAQDQKSEINELIDEMEVDLKGYTYDGDTSPTIRQIVRKAGHIVMTNPDMLHSAILPHHTKWVSLFENLKVIVIDELHTYRGVFGSHVANVIRRLKRICSFYGSNPIFICTSATIANPKELAEELTGEAVTLINNNGAPTGRKHFVLYNPPVVNQALNIRRSATLEARNIAVELLRNNIQTIVFARSRVRVEILLTYLQQLEQRELGPRSIMGYRGGYLPKQRREIEQGLRSGKIKGVVSTNALELGVDIGQLQACVLTGYPGTIASTWQQAGRAGRRQDESVVFVVASSSPLDQYMITHPDYFFERNPEEARVNPNNLIILVDHVKCAAYELPFKQGDTFGGEDVEDVLEFLTEEQLLHHRADRWFWMNDAFPAHNVSLRSASQENVVIIDQTTAANVKVIGEMDRFSAMTLLHEEAIYLHQGVQYQVELLDYEEKKAWVREVDVDYYTDANLAVQLKVLEEDQHDQLSHTTATYGEVMVNAMATIFKKIKFETHENIGSGPIHLPEEELHTNACWFEFPESFVQTMGENRLEEGLLGLGNVLRNVAPLFVMCDVSDLHVTPQIKAIHSNKPTIFFYDRYPGGIGLSERVYQELGLILKEAESIVVGCECESGCPSCVGVSGETGENSKDTARYLLEYLRGEHSDVTEG